ncbi:MAG: hypothetical protein Q9213_000739 [Squamulea squamosa]
MSVQEWLDEIEASLDLSSSEESHKVMAKGAPMVSETDMDEETDVETQTEVGDQSDVRDQTDMDNEIDIDDDEDSLATNTPDSMTVHDIDYRLEKPVHPDGLEKLYEHIQCASVPKVADIYTRMIMGEWEPHPSVPVEIMALLRRFLRFAENEFWDSNDHLWPKNSMVRTFNLTTSREKSGLTLGSALLMEKFEVRWLD